jgi:mycothiol synthase
MNAESAVSWRPLRPAEFSAVTELAEQCLAADGGQPFAADPDFLHRWYVADAESQAAWADDGARLVCVSSLRWLAPSDPAGPKAMVPVTTGLMHPEWRRRGLGGLAYDWAAGLAGQREIQAESESLSDGAHALYESRGLAQVLAEDVMQLAVGVPLPAPQAPGALTLTEWGAAAPARFYAVYAEAFRDRPGFPGWSQQRWIDWISDEEDFRPEWSLLASLGGSDVGFIAGDVTGWITQLGVVPAARGQGIGALLLTEAIRLMRSAGEATITLNVNVDNPRAAALYRRLGFARTGRRARYLPHEADITLGR